MPAPQLVLKVYDVPRGRTEEVRRVLDIAASPPSRVTRLDDGRVAVHAGETFHAGVKDLLAQLSAKSDSIPATVHLEYWVFAGYPSDDPSTQGMSRELHPVLEELTQRRGPMRFELVAEHKIASVSGAPAEAETKMAKFKQVANLVEEGLVADLEVEVRLPDRTHDEIETRVSLRAGQTAVIGHSGIRAGEGGLTGTLFYAVRPQVQ